MPKSPPVACTGPCNGRNLAYDGTHTCTECRSLKNVVRYRDRKANDPVHALYGWRWEKCKKALLGMGNVMCQRIVDGKRCQNVGQIWHHLISPRINESLMYVYANIVHVCRDHHSDILQDDPSLYVPTRVALGMAGETNPASTEIQAPVMPAPAADPAPLFYASGLNSENKPLPRRATTSQAPDWTQGRK